MQANRRPYDHVLTQAQKQRRRFPLRWWQYALLSLPMLEATVGILNGNRRHDRVPWQLQLLVSAFFLGYGVVGAGVAAVRAYREAAQRDVPSSTL